MTREELRAHCERQMKLIERCSDVTGVAPGDYKIYKEHELILDLLNEDSDAMGFARWVVETIFSGKVEEDPELFCELACRRLIKLGMVRPKGLKEWQIVGTPLDDMIKKLESEVESNDN